MERSLFVNDVKKNKLETKEPECMTNRPKINTVGTPLTEEETSNAKQVLVNKSFINLEFPKLLRNRVDPPLGQQKLCVFSFLPSLDAKPDKDNCFGVLKFRGSFTTLNEADEWCEYLIRNIDSYSENIIGYVGKDFPLTLDNKFCVDTKEIDVRSKMDNVARENIKKQREIEKKEMEEIQERQKKLLSDTKEEDKADSYDDVDYYTQLRVKRANIRMLQEECEKKLKECAKILKKTNAEIHELDDKHPEYKNQYEEKYKKALDSIGAEGKDNKMIQYMK